MSERTLYDATIYFETDSCDQVLVEHGKLSQREIITIISLVKQMRENGVSEEEMFFSVGDSNETFYITDIVVDIKEKDLKGFDAMI